MKLRYHLGKNFGDALNPVLFDNLLPGFFNDDEREVLLGIGSILGLVQLSPITKKVHVFTSGFAYGEFPEWTKRLDVEYLAVRGPLTADKFNTPSTTVLADGGILADRLLTSNEIGEQKKYKWSYIPHHYSIDKYDGFKALCAQIGVHLIDPNITENNTVVDVIREINRTELLIAEAMHGAIIADALRVPYIPVKSYKHINEFKWKDFAGSMNIELELHWLERLYSKEFLSAKLKQRSNIPVPFGNAAYQIAKTISLFNEDRFAKRMEKLIQAQPLVLSESNILNEKQEQLLSLLDEINNRH